MVLVAGYWLLVANCLVTSHQSSATSNQQPATSNQQPVPRV